MPGHRVWSLLRVVAIVAMAAFWLLGAGAAEAGTPTDLSGSVRNPARQGGQGGRRIALVIGNDAYEKVSRLEKAGNDAMAMARELKAAGFEVLQHRNLNYRGMVKAVETLANRITGGDQVVVFFAGHGVQIKSGSYLLPVDIEASSEGEVEKTAYGLTDLTEKLSEAKASFALVIVDACRDNPLRSKGRSVGSTRGLGAIEPPKGQMVVYSASRGQQALDRLSDNDQNPNGVFTREFITRMKQPGVRIEDLVREVQDAVEVLASRISHEQRPALYNESRGHFYFYGPTTPSAQPATDSEGEAWKAALEVASVEGYQAYLASYPNGRFAAAAKVKLADLKKRSPESGAAAPSPPKVAAESREMQLGNEVKTRESTEKPVAAERDRGNLTRLAQRTLTYKGVVDRMTVDTELTYYTDGRVIGYWTVTNRPKLAGIRYPLRGSIKGNDVILQAYTNEVHDQDVFLKFDQATGELTGRAVNHPPLSSTWAVQLSPAAIR